MGQQIKDLKASIDESSDYQRGFGDAIIRAAFMVEKGSPDVVAKLISQAEGDSVDYQRGFTAAIDQAVALLD